MTQYTVVFAMNRDHTLLIRKAKPDWQKGLLNGIGGKVEQGESVSMCARREFAEETGAHPDQLPTPLLAYHSMFWPEYKTHTGWPCVWFFAFEMSTLDMQGIQRRTREWPEPCFMVSTVAVKSGWVPDMMPNVPFLVSMAECFRLCSPDEQKLLQPVVLDPIAVEDYIIERGDYEIDARRVWRP